MATTFEVIFLGISGIDIDPTEGNTSSEDMGLLVGSTFGAPGDPLYGNVQTLSPVGSPGSTYDTSNNANQFSVDGTTYTFDGWGVYNITITYADGTTATAVGKIAQTTTGELYLVPDVPGLEANQALFEAKPIQSITLNSTGPQGTGMTVDRLEGNFIEPVDGTAGGDVMNVGFTDANGDMVTDGADVIRAGDGNDTINAGSGNDVIYGGAGNDIIDDWNGNDIVYAGIGNDTVNLSVGNDTVYMEAGDDRVVVADNAGTNTLFGGTGYDVLDFRNWQSTTGAEVDIGADGSGTFSHFSGATTGTFSEFEYISGTAYNDTMDAAASNVSISLVGEGGNDVLTSGTGDDVLFGDDGNDTLSAGAGSDFVDGGAGADLVDGGAGDDFIDGSIAADSLYGGVGNDTILGGADADLISGDGMSPAFNPAAHASAAGGAETVFTLTNATDLTLRLYWIDPAGQLLDYGLFGPGASFSQSTFVGHTWVIYDSATNQPLQYIGNPANGATITYVQGADSIDGGDGNDTIFAGGGNDTVFGGSGDDLVDLGSGNDSFGTFNADSAGNDTVYGGAGNDYIIGGGENDQLFGEAGDDTLSGGIGNDTLSGGDGSDVFLVTDDHDGEVIIGGEGGVDVDSIVFSNWTTTQGFNVTFDGNEQGSYVARGDAGTTGSFTQIEQIAGTEYADSIDGAASTVDLSLFGDDGNDTLRGGSGNDTLAGGAGRDRFFTSAGADTILGGAGRDRYDVSDGFDGNFVDFGSEEITVDAAISTEFLSLYDVTTSVDIVFTSTNGGTVTSGAGETLTFVNADGFEGAFGAGGTFDASLAAYDVTLFDYGGMTSVIGSAYDDRLGAYGADPLGVTDRYYDGGVGDDDLDTGNGNDTVLGGDGNDTIVTRAGDDLIFGGTGSDAVYAGTGSDTIYGGTGADSLFGDEDADTFRIEDNFGNDSINGGAGYDTIDLTALTTPVTVLFTAPGAGTITDVVTGDVITFIDIEQLILTDQSDVVDATLNNGYTYIQTRGGDDLVTGSSGDDIIDDEIGDPNGQGNDTFIGGDGADVLWGGNDDDLLIGGQGDDYIEGGADNDVIVGGAGSDSLVGGTGADTLTGGIGPDVFVVDAGGDIITDFDTTTGIQSGIAPDQTDNDFVDLSAYYNETTLAAWNAANPGTTYQNPIDWLRADQADGSLGQVGGLQILGVDDQPVAANQLIFENTGVICFAEGTLIATPGGEIPVEELRIGDLALTVDHGPQPLVWTGATVQDWSRDHHADKPILIKAGSLGPGIPIRDLMVSPQHRMLLHGPDDPIGFFVSAKSLLGSPGVRQMSGCRSVVYHHIMLEQHQVLISNGTPTESFYPGQTALRMMAPALSASALHVLTRVTEGAGLGRYPLARKALSVQSARHAFGARTAVTGDACVRQNTSSAEVARKQLLAYVRAPSIDEQRTPSQDALI